MNLNDSSTQNVRRYPVVLESPDAARIDTPEGSLIAATLFTFISDMNKLNRQEERCGNLKKNFARKQGLIREAKSEWIQTLCGFINFGHAGLVRRLQLMAEWGIIFETEDYLHFRLQKKKSTKRKVKSYAV